MANYEILSPNKYDGSGGYKKSIVVVHTSEPGAYVKGKNPGTAEGLGNYLKSSSVQASYHVAVDRDGNTCRMVADNNRAWHAGNIGNNEGYSICAVGWSAWSREEWLSMPKMLDSMAVQVAAWCKKEGIPAQYVAPANLVKDVWGITGHGDVAKAWRETDHTDPGNGFPYDVLISKVNAILKPIPKETAIQAKRRTSSWLGDPVTTQEELPTPDGVGRYREYANGMIYWTPTTGACALSSEMVTKYRDLGYETSYLKYPTSDVFEVDGGRCQRFQGGSLYYNDVTKGVYEVYGRIGAEWANWNWEKGHLGLPVANPVNMDVGAYQDYTSGKILWSNKTDAHAVYGMILNEFNNGGISKWGFPLKAEGDSQDMRARYQNFEFATLYYRWGDDKAFGVKDRILKAYKLLGYEVGPLGFPASDEKELLAGGVRQSFEHGYIEVEPDGDIVLFVNGEAVKL